MNHTKLFMLTFVFLTAFSCKKEEVAGPIDPNNRAGLFKSRSVEMGRGELYSWIQLNYEGKPTSLGFTMTKGSLEYLSNDSMGHDPAMSHNIWEVQLPKQAVQLTPFKHIGVNWNSKG